MDGWRRVGTVEEGLSWWDDEMAEEVAKLKRWLRTEIGADDALVEYALAKLAPHVAEARAKAERQIAAGVSRTAVKH